MAEEMKFRLSQRPPRVVSCTSNISERHVNFSMLLSKGGHLDLTKTLSKVQGRFY